MICKKLELYLRRNDIMYNFDYFHNNDDDWKFCPFCGKEIISVSTEYGANFTEISKSLAEIYSLKCHKCNIIHIFFFGRDHRLVLLSNGNHRDISFAANKFQISLDEAKKNNYLVCKCGTILKA